MKCKICHEQTNNIFSAIVVQKYNVNYYFCDNCGFLQTEEPYWFEESHS
jgi:protein-arginine kinase activator protein McsA